MIQRVENVSVSFDHIFGLRLKTIAAETSNTLMTSYTKL